MFASYYSLAPGSFIVIYYINIIFDKARPSADTASVEKRIYLLFVVTHVFGWHSLFDVKANRRKDHDHHNKSFSQ